MEVPRDSGKLVISSQPNEESSSGYDKLGYKKLENRTYYNRYLKKTVEHHPYM